MKNPAFGKYTINDDPADHSRFKEAVDKRSNVEMSVINSDTDGSPGGSKNFKTKKLPDGSSRIEVKDDKHSVIWTSPPGPCMGNNWEQLCDGLYPCCSPY
ncbi:MAG: hypothetical protein K9L17_04630 [Clostridiales bacterium]|nr:hypothetical protein [Clostridiales bacterium]MCF8021960.1 hypothetical protein [Clostridiales bacterium]